jgi:hypothetical protein
LRDNPKLWSVICASLPFRAFIGDTDNNPGAYVLTYNRNDEIAPYAVDAGTAFQYINDERALSQAVNASRLIQRYTDSSYVLRGALQHFDMDIMGEVTENIYNLPSERIRAIVEAVESSVPFFVLDGREQTVDHVCFKLEQSRQALAGIFKQWGKQINRECGLTLFSGSFPDMPSAKSPSSRSRRPNRKPQQIKRTPHSLRS